MLFLKLTILLLDRIKLTNCLLIDLKPGLQLRLQFLVLLRNLLETLGLLVNNLLHVFNVRFTEDEILQLLIVLVIINQIVDHGLGHLGVHLLLQIFEEVLL